MKMKLFTSTVFSVAGLLLAATFASAAFAQTTPQDQATPPAAWQPAQAELKHGDRFAGLNLTDDQKAQIKQIREDAKAKAGAVKADSKLSDAAKQGKVKAIRRAARRQTHQVLTPEQRHQLKTKRRERRAAGSQSSMMM